MDTKYFLYFALVLFIVLAGCTSKHPKKTVSQFRKLASAPVEMTLEESILHDCFTEAKVSCYEVYPYQEIEKRWGELDSEYDERVTRLRLHFDSCVLDNSMTCSEKAGRADLSTNLQLTKQNLTLNYNLISSMDWFFLSPSRINKFINFIKKISEIQNKISVHAKSLLKTSKELTLQGLHGTGIGITGSMFAGVGATFTGEALILDENIVLYCAPGLQLTTDVGVTASLSAIKALACKDKETYKGKFLSVQAGLSAEMLAIPAGVQAAYSFGVNTSTLLNELIHYKKGGQFNVENLESELILLQSVLLDEMANITFTRTQKAAVWLGIKLGRKLTQENDNFSGDLNQKIMQTGIRLSDLTAMQTSSLSNLLKYVIGSQAFQNILLKYKLRHLKIFFNSLRRSLTGCDSISGGASLSVSLSPIQAGASVHYYEDLFSANLDKILSLRNLSAFMLMNPLLMNGEALNALVDLAYLLENFSKEVGTKCFRHGVKNSSEHFSLLNELRE